MLNIAQSATIAVLATLFLALPSFAQNGTLVPDTIVVTTPENEARGLFNEGNALLREGDNEGALAKFEAGLALDAGSVRNAYGKALALVQLDREQDAVAAFELAIDLADAADDEETATAARRALGIISYRNALARLQAFPLPPAEAEAALPLLEQAEAGQVEQPMLPYQFARVYNALERFEDAERYALRAVEERDETAADNSALYYELGIARAGAGDKEGAIEAFEMAMDGQWAGWAEHQITQLSANADAPEENSTSGN